MNCSACKKIIDTKELMKCRLCTSKFHIQCLNIDKKQYLAFNRDYKSTWICPSCSNITRRARSNDNTPVRQYAAAAMALTDDNLNMPCDLPDPNACSPTSESTFTIATSNTKQDVTMERISTLLDEKLSTSLSMFMENFRKIIREDVKEMVKSEIGLAITTIKDEFSVTTVICAEQKTIQAEINKSTVTINLLEAENNKLQIEINRLNTRLAGMEKITRNCNIELQAVPERKNENILMLLKKLCQVVRVTVDDAHISACRRVAKLNTASNRPRNIVVTFSSPRVRDMVLSATHRYIKALPSDHGLLSTDLDITGESCKIYVTEHLSPEQKSLHAATKKAARDHGFRYVWLKYGQIYVRKDDSSGAILIKNLDSLAKLF
jgi:hypothetical protein